MRRMRCKPPARTHRRKRNRKRQSNSNLSARRASIRRPPCPNRLSVNLWQRRLSLLRTPWWLHRRAAKPPKAIPWYKRPCRRMRLSRRLHPRLRLRFWRLPQRPRADSAACRRLQNPTLRSSAEYVQTYECNEMFALLQSFQLYILCMIAIISPRARLFSRAEPPPEPRTSLPVVPSLLPSTPPKLLAPSS